MSEIFIPRNNMSSTDTTFCINPWHFDKTNELEEAANNSKPLEDHHCVRRLKISEESSHFFCPVPNCEKNQRTFFIPKTGNANPFDSKNSEKSDSGKI